jgi:hypothetical protein
MAFCLKLQKGRTFLINETLIVSTRTAKMVIQDARVVLPKYLEPALIAEGWKLRDYAWERGGIFLSGREAKEIYDRACDENANGK